MKKILSGLAVLGVIAMLAGAAAVLYLDAVAGDKRTRTYAVPAETLTLPADTDALRQGAYLFASRGCAECHGQNGGGAIVVNDGDFFVQAPDITPSGVGADYTIADWVRIIRHGVRKDGTAAFLMPSEDYNQLATADLAALISYSRSLPPANGLRAEIRLPLMIRALYALGEIKDAAEKIDHTLPPPAPVPAAATLEHGRYVAATCIGCHGTGLSGGPIPGMPPDFPPASNLTPGEGTVMTRYPTPQALAMLFRTKKRPDGSEVSIGMPFATLATMNDTDIHALHLYLQSVPPRPAGSR